MGSSDRDQKIIDRLIDLTLADRLDWQPVYGSDVQGGVSMDSNEHEPVGFFVHSPMQGTGRVILRLRVEAMGIDEPWLEIDGDQLDCDEEDLGILYDAIQNYREKVQAGETMSIQQRIQSKIEEELAPMRNRLEELKSRVANEREDKNRAMRALEGAMRGKHLPLTPQTFVSALQNLVDEKSQEARMEVPPVGELEYGVIEEAVEEVTVDRQGQEIEVK